MLFSETKMMSSEQYSVLKNLQPCGAYDQCENRIHRYELHVITNNSIWKIHSHSNADGVFSSQIRYIFQKFCTTSLADSFLLGKEVFKA